MGLVVGGGRRACARQSRTLGRTQGATTALAVTKSGRRRRRVAGLLLLAIVALITLLLTAFGTGRPAAQQTVGPALANRLLPAGPPSPEVIALEGLLRIQLPVAQSR